jgi:hypothetical protein
MYFFTLYIGPLIACNAESESTNITVFSGLKSWIQFKARNMAVSSHINIDMWLKSLVQTQLHDVITEKDLPHLITSEGDILIDTEYQNFYSNIT